MKGVEELIEQARSSGLLDAKYYKIILGFARNYFRAVEENPIPQNGAAMHFEVFLKHVFQNMEQVPQFSPYHVRNPLYTQMGMDLIGPLLDRGLSKVLGKDVLDQIAHQLKNQENVVLFANHQIEPDPQIIHLLLDPEWRELAQEMIFVAGERVLVDPLAVPFSLGCNLLCIYSKKYMDLDLERREEKQRHNKRAMHQMLHLLDGGGRCIYVAPSGGRDRKDKEGRLIPAAFDPQSVEMFLLMARQAKRATHFYPLALSTYDIMPPPETIQHEIGEERLPRFASAGISIGKELDFTFVDKGEGKMEQRYKRSLLAWECVCSEFFKL